MTTTPAGWYDDGRGSLRWWDGSQWTVTADESPSAGEPDLATELGFGEPSAAPASDADAVSGATPPTAYPGGYPGQSDVAAASAHPSTLTAQGTYPGAIEQEPPKRSRWWIWLVAGGALLVVLIVLAVIFIPMALRAVMGGAGGVGGGSADEQSAVAAVQTYDRAWQSIDCDLMVSATTEGFREFYDLTDCATFDEQAGQLAATTSDYALTVNSVGTNDDGTIEVETTETFVSQFDDEGNDTGTEQSYRYDYTYLVVSDEAVWLIDDFEVE